METTRVLSAKLVNDSDGNQIGINVDTTEGKFSIGFDEANRHYAAYLKWVAEGNTPEPADE